MGQALNNDLRLETRLGSEYFLSKKKNLKGIQRKDNQKRKEEESPGKMRKRGEEKRATKEKENGSKVEKMSSRVAKKSSLG